MSLIMDSELFCERLKEIRTKRKMTQLELAEKSGIAIESISRFEAGSRKPSLENFFKLIVVLNVPADFLLARTDEVFNSSIDPIAQALQNLPETERKMIEKFILSLQN